MALKKKGRNRRRFKPRKFLKRLFVLAIFLGIGLGFFWLGRGAYRLIAGWRGRPTYLTFAQAEQVEDMPGLAAEAVLLRQEVVVLADKPGRVNLVIEPGNQVESGRLVMEVVDKDLLAQIDTEIQKLEKGEQQGNPNEQSIADIENKLLSAQGELYAAMDSYKQALMVQAVENYNTLYNSLSQIAKGVVQLQQDHQLLAQSQVATAEQRQELEYRRQQAIVPIYAPTGGAVYFWVDGLEDLASPTKIVPDLWGQLQAGKSAPVYQTEGDAQVAAGQPVFKVAVDNRTYLLTQVDTDKVEIPPEWQTVSVCWQDKVFSARVVEHDGLASGQVLLLVEEASMALPRFMEVSLHKEGEVYCSIPVQAVTTIDNQNVVFVLEGNAVKAMPIEILQQPNKKKVIVVGLQPGMSVVTRPEGLVDGQDVTERLRK